MVHWTKPNGKEWAVNLGPLLFFFVLTAVMTWPLLLNMQHMVIGWLGDNVYYVWLLAWFQKALFQLHINPFFVPFHNSPEGWSLAYTETTLANVLTGLPFTLIGGPTFGYNAVIFLSFILSGWLVYLWVHEITGSRWAGLLAGTIFAFSPYRLAHSYGHLPLMGTQWLVLHYWGLYHILVKPRFRVQYALEAGLGLGLATLSSMYYSYMSLVVSAIFVAGYLLIVGWRRIKQADFWKGLLASGAVALPLVAAAAIPYLQLAGQGRANFRPLQEVDVWSASITDFLLPGTHHFLWGAWIERLIPAPLWIETYVYLGAITLALIAVACWGMLRKGEAEPRRRTLWLLFLIICTIVLAMGTTLHWLGKPVTLNPVPEFLKRWTVTAQGFIPLPNFILFKVLPFYSGMRVWERYAIFTFLFAALTAGLGYRFLANRLRDQVWVRLGLFALLLALVLIDFRINLDFAPLVERPVDVWLAEQPQTGAVVEFPIHQSTSPVSIYGSLIHRKPLLGMFYGAYLPENYRNLLPALNQFPDAQSAAILHEKGVRYVIVDVTQYPDWSAKWPHTQKLGFEEQVVMGDFVVLTLSSTEE